MGTSCILVDPTPVPQKNPTKQQTCRAKILLCTTYTLQILHEHERSGGLVGLHPGEEPARFLRLAREVVEGTLLAGELVQDRAVHVTRAPARRNTTGSVVA